MVNCTIAGNYYYASVPPRSYSSTAARGSGIYVEIIASLSVANSIIALNYGTSAPDISGTYTADASIIGGEAGFAVSPSPGTDGIWGTDDDAAGDLHLSSASPAIDAGIGALAVDAAGTPLTADLDGNPRIVGQAVDIGAYESPTARPAPTVTLSNTSVPEDRAAGWTVGTVGMANAAGDATYTYRLPQAYGDDALFTLSGTTLQTAASFDYAGRSSYAIKLKAIDQNGATLKKVFTITVAQNQAPTDITLSSSTVMEHLPAGTRVGVLSTSDPDLGEIFTYKLPLAYGDNRLFTIRNGKLKTAASFDYASQNTCQIKVKSIDLSGLMVKKLFTISMTPAVAALPAAQVPAVTFPAAEDDDPLGAALNLRDILA